MAATALNSADLYWIARYRSDGYSYSKLGELFSVSPWTISKALKQLIEGRAGPYGKYSNLFDEELGIGWRTGEFPNGAQHWATSKIQLCVESMCEELGWTLVLGVDNESWYIFPKGKHLKDLRILLGDHFGSFGANSLDIAKKVVSIFFDSSDGAEAFETLLKQLGPVYKYNGWTLNWS